MIKNYWTYNNSFLLIVIVFAFGCMNETKEKTKLADATSEEKKPNEDLQIIDISQKQLALYNKHLNTDSVERTKIFRDSLYYPYHEIWDGYVNGVETFDLVAEYYGVRTITTLNEKNKLFYAGDKDEALLDAFFNVRDGMIKLTGQSPKGIWYLLYGPSLANLGTVGNGVMFVDFAFPENKDLGICNRLVSS